MRATITIQTLALLAGVTPVAGLADCNNLTWAAFAVAARGTKSQITSGGQNTQCHYSYTEAYTTGECKDTGIASGQNCKSLPDGKANRTTWYIPGGCTSGELTSATPPAGITPSHSTVTYAMDGSVTCGGA